MPGIFIGTIQTIVAFILAIIGLVILVLAGNDLIKVLLQGRKSKNPSREQWGGSSGSDEVSASTAVAAVIGGLVMLIAFGWIFSYSATHHIVPLNKQAIVTDRFNPQIIGNVRREGITEIPFLTGAVMEWPGGSREQLVLKLTPSTNEGVEVTVELAVYIDMTRADWINVYRKYNKTWESYKEDVLPVSAAPLVAGVIEHYFPRELTSRRAEVGRSLSEALSTAFSTDGLPVLAVELKNWDFTSKQAAESYDAAAMKQSVAAQDLEAAKIEQQAAMIRIETRKKESDVQLQIFETLGITDDAVKAQIIGWNVARDLLGTKIPIIPILNFGGSGGVPIAINPPAMTTAPTSPTAVPKK